MLDPAAADVHAVTGIAYNARGQRLVCGLGNGATTTYSYDPDTFRMTNLTTVRPNPDPDARSVQLLDYTFDPVGNVTRIRDSADIHNVIFFRNQRVEPSASYTYDPLYRLISASGREHLGQNGAVLRPAQQISNDDSFRAALLAPGDGNAMGNYTELYTYDAANNIQSIVHQVASGGWTRRYAYTEPSAIDPAQTSNRLSATSQPGDNPAGPFSERYTYDFHGNMTATPHLPVMRWNESDRLQSTARQVVTAGTPESSYYVYDASGERARKVTNWQASAAKKSERIYLGAFEIYREFAADGTTITLERETLHVMDEQRRAAIVETRTAGNDGTPVQLVRYQFGNHLGSSAVELDSNADVISYEEYFPFGATSYRAGRTMGELVLKRYRYTGRERDTENDFTYHGARYCASWLGRWISPDPAGLSDGTNVYAYTSNNPVRMVDPNGTEGKETDSGIIKADIGAVFRTPAWKAAVRKANAYQPRFMSRDEERAWREAREAKEAADEAAKKTKKTDPAPDPGGATAPNTDPPQASSPPGASYQAAPAQLGGGFSAGGFWQYLYLSNYASQYAANAGLLAPGGDYGLELLVQGTHTIDPSGNAAGSVTGGIHAAHTPQDQKDMYNEALYLVVTGTFPGPHLGFAATAVGERLIGEHDTPWLTLGLNISGSYLSYLNVSPVGAPPMAPSTNLNDSLTGGGVANATFSLLYKGKTPQLQLWAEGFGSYSSGTPGRDPGTGAVLPSGNIAVGGGGGGVTYNRPFGANGYNILTLGVFAGGRYERDQVGSTVTQSSQLYLGGGAGFARRF